MSRIQRPCGHTPAHRDQWYGAYLIRMELLISVTVELEGDIHYPHMQVTTECAGYLQGRV